MNRFFSVIFISVKLFIPTTMLAQLQENLLRLFSAALLFLFISPTVSAQNFTGKFLKWDLSGAGDKRITAFIGSTGWSMGSEGTSVLVQNLSETKLYVKFLATYSDFCGNKSTHTFSLTVNPKAKAGGSPWFDGHDFSTKCKSDKQYNDKFRSRLSNIKLELVSIKEAATANTNTDKNKAIDCKQLVQYRDNKLPALWDRQRNKYKIKAELVSDIKNLKDTLLKTSKVATSDWQIVRLTLKMAANTIEDLINISSPQGHLLKTAKDAGVKYVTKVAVYEAIKKGDKALEALYSEDVHNTILTHAVTDLGKLGSLLGAIKNFRDNINNWSDYQEVKGEVNKQMAALNKAVDKYNSELNKTAGSINEINQYKNYIDAYLAEHCKDSK
ncbi:hypothetical protein EV199_0281 [Pseudobacter ginsenosidimutans]|uniref:Uncharacterized protein n=2 Tax=Pseudobacter ginsenosidimutans TaxID=661488 RepID=A0A4Q7MZN9_9BACT|nr:hypothetical protein EV199_0281 [Pseudobacter ginsenosidimutans]